MADDVAGPLLEQTLAKVRRAGHEINGEQLTRVPSGFDRDHPRAELLRYKTLVGSSMLGVPEWLSTPEAGKQITRALRKFAPLTSWLDTHVGAD